MEATLNTSGIDFKADSGTNPDRTPTTVTLAEISGMAQNALTIERQIAAGEIATKALKERLRLLLEESIPMAMQEIELTEYKLATGEKITIGQKVYAAIPVARREEAFAWLVEKGFGGLLKMSVSCDFGKSEDERAAECKEILEEEGFKPVFVTEVHTQTLQAFLKEQLEAAKLEIPLDMFGARPVWVAKIKAAK